jgi:myo-inositol-1(or 4)-monophosphatase
MDLPASTSGRTPLEVARLCAAEARHLLRDAFGRAVVMTVKGRGNVLTEFDLAVEQSTMHILAREYPDHAILSEETAAETRSDGWMWVVDPIDGTRNFSRAIPHFCYMIALCFDSRPLVGLTLQPLLDEEFSAVKGEGAWLNGLEMKVTQAQTVNEGIVALDMGYDDALGRQQLDLALYLWPGMESLRVPGSAGLGMAYVAAGRYDVFVHTNLSPWDLAPGILLVEEAGGTVTTRPGGPASIYGPGVVAAAPAVHADFMRLAAAFEASHNPAPGGRSA